MKTETIAGVLLLVAPVWFNAAFTLLARTFDYPDILRRPTDEILRRFRAGGPGLITRWWAFMLSGVLLVPIAVLLGAIDGGVIARVAAAVGILAGLVQVVGLLRWVYLVPYLARTYSDPLASPATRDAVGVVFQSFHRFLGVGVGEHLGYLFTGLWTLLVGTSMVAGAAFPSWLGWIGVVLGGGLVVVSAEFLGRHEEHGWELVGKAVPVVYILWSLWLATTGVVLLGR